MGHGFFLLTHNSQLTAHCSPLTAHRSSLIAHCSLLTAHCSPLTAHRSPLTTLRLSFRLSLSLFRLHSFHLYKVNEESKRHGEVDIAFWNMEVEAFSYQGHTDDQKETKRQHFEGWVL